MRTTLMGISEEVSRLVWDQKIVGSIPTSPISLYNLRSFSQSKLAGSEFAVSF